MIKATALENGDEKKGRRPYGKMQKIKTPDPIAAGARFWERNGLGNRPFVFVFPFKRLPSGWKDTLDFPGVFI